MADEYHTALMTDTMEYPYTMRTFSLNVRLTILQFPISKFSIFALLRQVLQFSFNFPNCKGLIVNHTSRFPYVDSCCTAFAESSPRRVSTAGVHDESWCSSDVRSGCPEQKPWMSCTPQHFCCMFCKCQHLLAYFQVFIGIPLHKIVHYLFNGLCNIWLTIGPLPHFWKN